MKALVTGGLGFTGRHLARRLAADPGTSVIGVDLDSGPAPEGLFSAYLPADLAVPGTAAHIVKEVQPDWVFHLSGRFAGPVPELYRSNLLAALEVLDALSSYRPAAKLLLAGSSAEYGAVSADEMPITEETPCAPVSWYGHAKHAATEAALHYARRGLSLVVVRPFNIVGAGVPATLVVGAILERVCRAVDQGDDQVPVGNLDCQRDFVAVGDVVDAYVKLMTASAWGQVINVCSGRPSSIRAVVETLLSYAPAPIRAAIDPALCRADDVPVSYGSWERAHRVCGFVPVTALEDALRMAWEGRLGPRRTA